MRLLFGAALLLLLITCANVGGLLLARSVARARETAVRVALGAGLSQLARQYFLEGLLVSLPGAAGGLLFSLAVVRVLVELGGEASARVGDGSGGLAGRRFRHRHGAGRVRARQHGAPLAGRAHAAQRRAERRRARVGGSRSRRLSRSFVVAEVALAFVLLAVSTVLVSEIYHVTRIWPGFDPAHLLTFQLSFAADEIPGKPSQVAYQTRLLNAVEAIPGVSGAGVSQPAAAELLLHHGDLPGRFLAPAQHGRRRRLSPHQPGLLSHHGDSSPPRPPADGARHQRRPAARGHQPGRRQALLAGPRPRGRIRPFKQSAGRPFQVVGVVGDVKNNGLDSHRARDLPALRGIAHEPNEFRGALFAAAENVDPGGAPRHSGGQPRAAHPRSPHDERHRARSVALKLVASSVMSFFAFAALLMATLGTYGVVSYSVRQRTVEMGTRMALGATSRDLLYLVIGFRPAHGGIRGSDRRRRRDSCHATADPPIPHSTIQASCPSHCPPPFWRASRLRPRSSRRGAPPCCPQWWPSATSPVRCGKSSNAGLPQRTLEDLPPSPDADMMTALVEASRHAAGFREAIRAALEALRSNVGAQSALLLEGRRSRGIPRHRIGSGPGLGNLLHSPKWPAAEPPAILWRALAGHGRRPRHGAPLGERKQAGAPHGDRDAGKHWRKPGGGAPHQERSAGRAPAGSARGSRPLQRRGEARAARLRGSVRPPAGECAPDGSRGGTGKSAARSRAGGRSAKAAAAAPGPGNHHGVAHRPQSPRPQRGRRLLRFPGSGQRPHRHRAGRRGGQRHPRRAHHVGGAGIFTGNFVGARISPCRSSRPR